MSFDKIILQLKLIASVPEKGRIRRNYDGGLSIEESSSFQPLVRIFNRDSRKTALRDISEIIQAAFEKSDDLMNCVYLHECYDLKINEEKQYNNVLHNITTLQQCLHDSIKGIENLQGTYLDDKNITLELTLLIDKVGKKVEEISAFIQRVSGKHLN